MKILSLTICNYKNYCGEQKIDFTIDDPQKNITLVGGQNGAGKTTLFESIKLCMFGHQYDGKPLSAVQYQQHIRDCQNRISVKEGDNNYFIEMEVVLDDVQPVYTVTLRRSWKITPTSFDEDFVILRDGLAFEIVERENWQQYIYDMFPPYIIEYFFFDGEKMQGLISGDRAESILRDSARDLIGLKIYDTLLTDVGVLKDKIKKSTKKDEKVQAEYDKLTAEVSEYKETLAKLNAREEVLKEEIQTRNAEIEQLRNEIQRKAGAFAKSHDSYQAEIKGIEVRLAELNLKIADLAEYVPFIMAAPLMEKALKQLNDEKALRESLNDEDLVEKVRVHLALEFAGEKSVVQKINSTLDKFLETRKTDATKIIHDASNSTILQVTEYVRYIQDGKKKEFLSLLKEREEKDLQLQKIEAAKRTMPEMEYVSEEWSLIEKKKTEIGKKQEELGKISAEKNHITPLYEATSKKLNEIDTASLKVMEDKSKYEACEKIEAILQDYISYTLTTKVKLLEDTISSMYLKLENKEDLVERMVLNPATFELTLIGYDGKVVNKNNLSFGEKEIYVLSILWGLSQLSKSHLPIVVDSFLARLDESHVGKVAEYFLPNAGEQVLILSHNREVNKEIYPLLKPRISNEYLLSYDQKTKISKGYFKECV